MRYSGVSIAYQMGGMVGGAVTPLVAVALQRSVGWTVVALYVTALALVSLVAWRRCGYQAATAGEREPSTVTAPAP